MKGFAFKDQSSPGAGISKWIVFIFITSKQEGIHGKEGSGIVGKSKKKGK